MFIHAHGVLPAFWDGSMCDNSSKEQLPVAKHKILVSLPRLLRNCSRGFGVASFLGFSEFELSRFKFSCTFLTLTPSI